MKNLFKNWRIREFFKLLLEIVFLIIGGIIIFPTVFILGVLYSFFKHLFFKFDYSISKQLLPIIRSITLASDGLANAGGGELLNDVLKVKKEAKIKYGKWYQTISAVTGLRKVYDNEDSWLRRFLKVLGKNHCEEAITEQEKFYYSNNINKTITT